MPRFPSLFGAAALLLGAVSCRDAQPSHSVPSQDPNFRPFVAGDSEMQAAIAHARASTRELLGRLEQPPRSQTFVSIKVRIEDPQGAEHLWLDSVRYDGRHLVGRVNNEPQVVQTMRRGDVVRVAPGEITDWMAIDGGRLCGGYTVRLHRRRLRTAERAVLEGDSRFVRVPTDTSACTSAGPTPSPS